MFAKAFNLQAWPGMVPTTYSIVLIKGGTMLKLNVVKVVGMVVNAAYLMGLSMAQLLDLSVGTDEPIGTAD